MKWRVYVDMEETTLGESQITMPVKGMSCAGCVSRVERALSAVDGVSNAEVNLATKRATVSYDPDATAPKARACRRSRPEHKRGRGH